MIDFLRKCFPNLILQKKFLEEDYVSFMMTPEIVVDFVQNEKLWNEKTIQKLMRERTNVMKVLSNKAKDIDFFSKNKLVFLFQKNIVKNKKLDKDVRWFEFAEQTKNIENKEDDFKKFQGDPAFDEMMRRLNRTILTKEDLEYIKQEKESWEEVKRYDMEHYEEGLKEGEIKGEVRGEIKGEIKALKSILENQADLPDDFINSTKAKLAALNKQLEEINDR